MVIMKKKNKKISALPCVIHPELPAEPITGKRKDILLQYCDYIKENKYIPAQREFAEVLKMTPSGLREHFEAISKAGYFIRVQIGSSVSHYIPINMEINMRPLTIKVKDAYVNDK